MCEKRDSFAAINFTQLLLPYIYSDNYGNKCKAEVNIYIMKNIILLSFSIFLFTACNNDKTPKTVELSQIAGETMGTYYKVTYRDNLQRNFKAEIDSLLIQVNAEVSTYEPESTISLFNKTAESIDLENNVFSGSLEAANHNKHFITNFLAAKQVYEESKGSFDPTVMPLVNYWGFGYTPKKAVEQADTVKIDSIMQYVGFDKVDFRRDEESIVKKSLSGVKLDFSACAKGYGVDAVRRLLRDKNLKDFYVEIGGESAGNGNGSTGNGWTVAVAIPKAGVVATDVAQIIRLKDKAIATSGNYINFHEVNGKKYAHTISPQTGFPKASNLLSASIFTDECMMSDAYATACMVMGLEEAKAFIEGLQGVEALFIFSNEKGELETVYTEGVKDMIVE